MVIGWLSLKKGILLLFDNKMTIRFTTNLNTVFEMFSYNSYFPHWLISILLIYMITAALCLSIESKWIGSAHYTIYFDSISSATFSFFKKSVMLWFLWKNDLERQWAKKNLKPLHKHVYYRKQKSDAEWNQFIVSPYS